MVKVHQLLINLKFNGQNGQTISRVIVLIQGKA
jgi:hypothetical protein